MQGYTKYHHGSLNSSWEMDLNIRIEVWVDANVDRLTVCLFDLGLTSLSTFFSHIATVSGCGRELNAHF